MIFSQNKLYKKLKLIHTKFKVKNKVKYFCIGSGKTGTTSLQSAFQELGFYVGDQRTAELLSQDCFSRNYKPLIKYCKTAQVFQDVPFCFHDIYKILDENFPNSKFILSIRDSSDQWYGSLTKFHAKIFGNGRIPTWETLKNIDYVYKGWSYMNRKNEYNLSEKDNPYDKNKLTSYYENRNKEIIEYFKDRPEDLLVINLSTPNAYQEFCKFINVKPDKEKFPWKNKTEDIIL